MIAKDFEPSGSNHDSRELAGQRAEKQMAYYLDRRFASVPDVWVFHGLRFCRDGFCTQIDHLLLTRVGFLIVESKSVTTRVRINNEGEWERLVYGHWKGMPSPLLQGEAQMRSLLGLLNEHRHELLSKFLGLQRGFGGFRHKVLCAISDDGIIERSAQADSADVLKADQVANAAAEWLGELEAKTGLKGLLRTPLFGKDSDPVITLTPDELAHIKDWLLKRHVPMASELVQNSTAGPLQGDAPSADAGEQASGSRLSCATCAAPIAYVVASFCWKNKRRFGGNTYCRECQKDY